MPGRIRLPGRAPRYQRHKPGVMNQTETRYAAYLDTRLAAGEIAWYAFEQLKLKIADKCWLTVDFVVQASDGEVYLVDTKAKWSSGDVGTDTARVKMKAVARLFPFRMLAAVWSAKGGWTHLEF
jgi:hypothetical protein